MTDAPILIIDDNPVNLRLLELLLTGQGFDVHTSRDAERALDLLVSFRPRLILTDIQLPGLDGLELTRRLKADPHTRDIVVVAVTAYAMKGDKEKALDAGCDGYTTKPIDTRTFPLLVRRWLARDSAANPVVETGEPAGPFPDPFARVPALAGLRQRFLDEGVGRCGELLAGLDGVFDSAAAAGIMHQWIGAAGLLGLADISHSSREAERVFRERPLDGAEARDVLCCLVDEFALARSNAAGQWPLCALRASSRAGSALPHGLPESIPA